MKRITTLIIAAVCCLCAVFPGSALADAAPSGAFNYQDAGYYVVVDAWDGYVNFRYGPGLEYGIISPIYNGEYLYVTQTANNYYDDFTWGAIEWGGSYGWVSLHECTYVAYEEPTTKQAEEPAPAPAADIKVNIDINKLQSGEWQSAFDTIVDILKDGMNKAYAPYREYKTSAVLVDAGGNTYSGVFVENSNPDLSICAEAAALAKAVSEGSRNYTLLAVIGSKSGSQATDYYVPCKDCQDIMKEFVNSGDFYVLTIQLNADGSIANYQVRTLGKIIAEN